MTTHPPQHEEVDFVERRNSYRRKEDKYLASLIDMHIGMSARRHKDQYRYLERMMKQAEHREVMFRTIRTQVAIWAVIALIGGMIMILSTGAHTLVKGWVLSSGGTQWKQSK